MPGVFQVGIYYGCHKKILCFGVLLIVAAIEIVPVAATGQVPANSNWPAYGNDPGGMRFSSLTQINRETVSKLKLAWTFHTGNIADGKDGHKRSSFETTPLLVDGTLFLTTPFNRVIALDPSTGTQRWAYDPEIDRSLDYGDGLVNRGVATWVNPSVSQISQCRRQIFEATLDARLIALDARTGKPCASFGRGGQVDLREVPGYQNEAWASTSRVGFT